MDLSTYKFPKVTGVDIAFPTCNTSPELVKEAESRNPQKGIKKFNQLFYSGGTYQLKSDVKGTWKEDAFRYARCLMGSFSPSHENKEIVCAMIFEECLEL